MQTITINVREEKTMRATDVSMAMKCKVSCDIWEREVVGIAGDESSDCAEGGYSGVCDVDE